MPMYLTASGRGIMRTSSGSCSYWNDFLHYRLSRLHGEKESNSRKAIRQLVQSLCPSAVTGGIQTFLQQRPEAAYMIRANRMAGD